MQKISEYHFPFPNIFQYFDMDQIFNRLSLNLLVVINPKIIGVNRYLTILKGQLVFRYQQQRRIQNPVKHPRWSFTCLGNNHSINQLFLIASISYDWLK